MPDKPEKVLWRVIGDEVLKSPHKLTLLALLFSENNTLGIKEISDYTNLSQEKVEQVCKRLEREQLVEVVGYKVILAIKVEGQKIVSCNKNERLKNPLLAIKDRYYSLYKDHLQSHYVFHRGDMTVLRRLVNTHGSNVVYSALDNYFDEYVSGREKKVCIDDFGTRAEKLINKHYES